MIKTIKADDTIYASVIELTEEQLMKVLLKVYIGEGLYIFISKITLDWLDGDDPYLTYEITYGRENTFEQKITLSPAGNEDFFLGQIYENILKGE